MISLVLSSIVCLFVCCFVSAFVALAVVLPLLHCCAERYCVTVSSCPLLCCALWSCPCCLVLPLVVLPCPRVVVLLCHCPVPPRCLYCCHASIVVSTVPCLYCCHASIVVSVVPPWFLLLSRQHRCLHCHLSYIVAASLFPLSPLPLLLSRQHRCLHCPPSILLPHRCLRRPCCHVSIVVPTDHAICGWADRSSPSSSPVPLILPSADHYCSSPSSPPVAH